MKFRKYEMTYEQWQELKPLLDGKVVNAVELGELTEGKFSIDILWNDEILEDFNEFEIWCEPVGSHSFGYSIDLDYINEYYARNPIVE